MKAFCLEFYHQVGLRVMAELHSRHGIEPVMWSSSHLLEEPVQATFPQCVFVHGGKAKMGVLPPSLQHCAQGPFDSACEHVWNNWHHEISDMMRRWDFAGDYTMLEMSMDFYEQLIAWNSVLEHLKPDFVFLWEPPHVQYSMMLYMLARFRRIPVFCILPTVGPFSLVSGDFGGAPKLDVSIAIAEWESQAGYKQGVIHEEVALMLARATKDNYLDGIPWWQKNYLAFKSGKVDWTFIKKMYRLMREHLRRDWYCRQRKIDLQPESQVQGIYPQKEKGKRVRDSYIGPWAWLRFGRFEIRNYLVTMSHERAYVRHVAKELPRGTKYVFVCLSFQPELTSNPLGGIFLHQWLMANIVAHSVPADCEVWIKEHPAQFVSLGGTSSYRNPVYYDLLAALPRTRLVPLHADQFDLIDNSMAVATLTGTVGFEAIARGKPTLIFGDVWYNRASMAFRVRSLSDCREAMRKIQAGESSGGIAFQLLLEEISLSAFRFGAEASLAGVGKSSTEENVREMADHICKFLNLPLPSDPAVVRTLEFSSSDTTPSATMTDWNVPIEQLPEEIGFKDLPPLPRELVRRNVALREKLASAESELAALKKQFAALTAPEGGNSSPTAA